MLPMAALELDRKFFVAVLALTQFFSSEMLIGRYILVH